jgi:nucleotide-binding universal stress UspA family protein
MKKISKIMVACDFSEYSKQSLKYAAELAEDLKAGIIITHVINERDVNSIRMAAMYNGNISEDKFIQDKMESRLTRIDELIEEISAGHLPVKKVIKVGIPFRELIQTVRDEGADLVVMGPKGRSNIEDILFGSTAEKMFRHCPVPLLSIRENRRR